MSTNQNFANQTEHLLHQGGQPQGQTSFTDQVGKGFISQDPNQFGQNRGGLVGQVEQDLLHKSSPSQGGLVNQAENLIHQGGQPQGPSSFTGQVGKGLNQELNQFGQNRGEGLVGQVGQGLTHQGGQNPGGFVNQPEHGLINREVNPIGQNQGGLVGQVEQGLLHHSGQNQGGFVNQTDPLISKGIQQPGGFANQLEHGLINRETNPIGQNQGGFVNPTEPLIHRGTQQPGGFVNQVEQDLLHCGSQPQGQPGSFVNQPEQRFIDKEMSGI